MLISENSPLEQKLGQEIGNAFLQEHERNGVKVHAGKDLAKLEFSGDSEGKVSKIILSDGVEIEADLVIVANGSKPNT